MPIRRINRFGLWAGGWMTLARILRCHPWGTSGLDFVPAEPPAGIALVHAVAIRPLARDERDADALVARPISPDISKPSLPAFVGSE